MLTPDDARDRLRRVASAVTEASEPAAVDRLLEKLAERDDRQELRDALVLDRQELRDALVLEGAAAVLREARP